MSVMKRHMHSCPRAGTSPVRARAELVIKRQPGWSQQGNHIRMGQSQVYSSHPWSKMANADERTARLTQSLMSWGLGEGGMTLQVPWCSEELLEINEEPCVVSGKLSDNSHSYQVPSLNLVLWATHLVWGRTESYISKIQIGGGDRAATTLPHPAPWCRQHSRGRYTVL